MKTKTFRKLTAVVLAVMLTLSMCITGLSASAAVVSDGTAVVYLKPNSNWAKDNARFAAYLYKGVKNAWVDMEDDDSDGYYSVTLPKGDWDKVIFCRMNPKKAENNWDNKWNQTSDLDIPEGKNCYIVADGTWDKGGGQWVSFTVGEEPSTEATEQPDYDYTVAGDAGLTGVAWDPAQNPMSDEDGDGIYEITFKDVAAGTYGFKVTNGTWGQAWPTANYNITITTTADITIKFNSATKEIEAVSEAIGEFKLETMSVVGDKGLVGAQWDPKAEQGIMKDMGNGVWSVTYTGVAKGTYKYKFIANQEYTYNWTVEGYFNSTNDSKLVVAADNSTVTLTIDISAFDFAAGSGKVTAKAEVSSEENPTGSTEATEATEATVPADDGYYLVGYINGENHGDADDYQNLGDYKFVDGKVTVNLTETSYVCVKSGDNTTWYMTDGFQKNVTEVTLYNVANLDETADKFMVPAGKVEFTLVDNGDDTLTLSYVVLEAPSTSATEATEATEATVPANDDYYLVGYINGENHGDADDYQNLGDYKFVDGKVTVNLTETSYVCVKSSDNKTWYMTDGFQQDVTEVTLYNVADLDETADKFMIPAGKVEFTLVDNGDDTLTLSYNVVELPSTEATEGTTEAPEEKVAVIGDISLDLKNVSGSVYTGTADLASGTYKFKISANGKTYGSGVAFTDKLAGSTYKTTWNSFSTMTATGGEYTFTFDVAAGKLTVNKNSVVSVTGDINLVLSKKSDSVYTGTTDLANGTYKFKIKANDKTYGSGVAFTDKVTDATYKTTWSSSSTMTATGGEYTFTFDAAAGKLTVAKKASGASIIGDIELNLENVSDDVYSGTIDLTAGSYKFKIKANDKTYGSGVAFTDKVTGATYKTTWSSSSTLTATGGEYIFTFDAAAGKLTVAKRVSGASIIGDIALGLENVSGDVYSGTINLAAGTYKFKIKANDKTYGSGVAFTDKVTGATYKTTWSSFSTMTATGGEYTFKFDAAAGKLTVSKKASETAVSVIGDINLGLTETADGVFTGTTDLAEGTYQFKIKANGKTYGRGAVFTDKIAGAVYKTTWSSSSTMTATGGTYTFTFDTNNGTLSVSK